jgi:hypothetical protein
VVQTKLVEERQLRAEGKLPIEVLVGVTECDARRRQNGRRDCGLQVPGLESREQETDLLLVRRVGYGCINSRKAECHKESTRDLFLLVLYDGDSRVPRQSRRDVLDPHTKTD